MGKESIIEKLNIFIANNPSIKEECQAVYLMVQIRKILDHENDNKYPLLRFYCNWTVHVDKKTTEDMGDILNDIFLKVKQDIEKNALIPDFSHFSNFIYMKSLKSEMSIFFQSKGIILDMLNDDNWHDFLRSFTKVLEEQPINNPTEDIKQFCFEPAAIGCVRAKIIFKKPIEGKYYAQLSNVY